MNRGTTELRAAGGERTPRRWLLRAGLMASLLVTLIASAVPPASAAGNPLAGRAMWIWVLGSSDGGNLGSIIGQAHAEGVSTLMIKSGDGSGTWSQFNSGVVATLHHAGLRVCAWQYVYGDHPISEAYVGAAAVKAGADCLLIDAESEYEGKYVQAQSYIGRLRKLIGSRFPVALAGFPYVDYHPGFPYSVFLGPGAAQYNVPQMYWKDIGTSVDEVYAHTFVFNRPYKRAIFPLGQVYNSPPTAQILRFRQLSRAYATRGVSWWDWQEASSSAWRAVAQKVGAIHGFAADTAYATVGRGARGDLVVWAQEHLRSAGQPVTVDGAYGQATAAAVAAFQVAHHLAPSGTIDTITWQALLRYQPARVTWVSSGGGQHARVTAAQARAQRSTVGAGALTVVPQSASLAARRDEIPPTLGAGGP